MPRLGIECEISQTSAPDWQIVSDVPVQASGPVDHAVSDASVVQAATDYPSGFVSPCPGWKRCMDLVGAILGLAMFWPIFLAVAALIKCTSPGPVFFRQRRFGVAGRPFILWKFRTMEINDASTRHQSHVSGLMESNKPLAKRDYELAIIPGCQLLRKLGLDELPQLINVLKGEMSLIGPRPDVVPPKNYQSWQQRRFAVLPGITGLWQVCGKNDTTFATMMRLDILYVRRRSFVLDVFILLRTIPAIVRG